VDGKKLGSAVDSLQRALGSVVPVQMSQREPGVFSGNIAPIHFSITPIEGKPYTAEGEGFQKLADEVQKEVKKISGGKGEGGSGNLENQIKFILEKRGLVIRISEHLFFDSGDASIRSDFIPLLSILAHALEKIPNHIRIEGHTDNVPIKTSKYPSNWELSTTRATTIVRYLLRHFDFEPEKLSATGYAEFRPVDSNKTAEGRLQNRRVDFIILSLKEMELEPQRAPEGKQQNESI
jgi:chemotaxis protein MotB